MENKTKNIFIIAILSVITLIIIGSSINGFVTNNKIENYEKIISENKEDINYLSNEIVNLKKQISDNKEILEEIKNLENKIDYLEDENEDLEEKIKDLEEEIDDMYYIIDHFEVSS